MARTTTNRPPADGRPRGRPRCRWGTSSPAGGGLAASRAGCSLAEIATAMGSTERAASAAIRSAPRDERDSGVIVAAPWVPR